ncbi:hypothetical protein [Legionella israelensis]|nr:hypothetical protein [Legionella israelensis]QBS08694.1 hypothetical protein E4T55_01770 [Legionella israelensis]
MIAYLLLFLFLLCKQLYAHKIVYAMEIENGCKKALYNIHLKYGEIDYGSEEYSVYSGAYYSMSMEIPEMAYISWKDSQRKPHKVQIPITSLLTKRDMRIRNFEVQFSLCDDKLTVYYRKPTTQRFFKEKKEIWPEQKYIGITPE